MLSANNCGGVRNCPDTKPFRWMPDHWVNKNTTHSHTSNAFRKVAASMGSMGAWITLPLRFDCKLNVEYEPRWQSPDETLRDKDLKFTVMRIMGRQCIAGSSSFCWSYCLFSLSGRQRRPIAGTSRLLLFSMWATMSMCTQNRNP